MPETREQPIITASRYERIVKATIDKYKQEIYAEADGEPDYADKLNIGRLHCVQCDLLAWLDPVNPESEQKHTPGPWLFWGARILRKEGGEPREADIAEVEIKHDAKETQANGHLIAAAPDLLEACKEMYEAYELCGSQPDYDHQSVAMKKAEAAINKAEGKEIA